MPVRSKQTYEGLLFTTALALLCGCGGRTSSVDSVDGGGPIVVPGPVDALRDAFCRAARTCCARAGAPFGPLENCELNFDPLVPFTNDVAKGTVIFDEGKLGPCIARMDEQSRTCQLERTICDEAFSGTFSEGEPCDHVAECKGWHDGPTVCLKAGGATDSSLKGVCRAIPSAKEGEWCSDTCRSFDCTGTLITFEPDYDVRHHPVCREDDGLFCESVCRPLNADGTPCMNFNCSSDSYCDTLCKPRKAHGEACTTDYQCRDEHTCTNGICTARPFATETLCKGGNF